MNDWKEFKKTFTQKQEDAIWQYMIDHSTVEKNGYYRIFFHVKNVDDLWRRMFARFSGDFKRYEKAEKEYQATVYANKLIEKSDRHLCQVVNKFDKGNNLWDKIVLKVYRLSRDYMKNYKL